LSKPPNQALAVMVLKMNICPPCTQHRHTPSLSISKLPRFSTSDFAQGSSTPKPFCVFGKSFVWKQFFFKFPEKKKYAIAFSDIFKFCCYLSGYGQAICDIIYKVWICQRCLDNNAFRHIRCNIQAEINIELIRCGIQRNRTKRHKDIRIVIG